MVFGGDIANPTNDSSTQSTDQLLSSQSGTVLAENSRDSGIPQSEQDNSTTLNGTPPTPFNDNNQPLTFHVSFSPDCIEESTDY